MAIRTTVTEARASFAAMCDAAACGETVIIQRPGRGDVALIRADELRSLKEMRHLLRSPENARRLLRGMFRVLNDADSRGTANPEHG